MSRKAAGKGKAVLEGVGLDTETIDACYKSNPLDEEGAVQLGLTKWSGGQGHKSSTWGILLEAMNYAQIAQQHVKGLKQKLGLLGMFFYIIIMSRRTNTHTHTHTHFCSPCPLL